MADAGKFSCTSCKRQYVWKPELAGKKVRCKCGGVVAVPQSLQPAGGADDAPDLDDLYQLAGDDKSQPAAQQDAGGMRCPDCQADLEPGAMLCLACGMNFKTGKRMQTSLTDSAPPRGGRPVLAMAGGGAALATPAGTLPRTLGYAGRNPRANDREAENAKGMIKNLTGPIIMVCVGLILMMAHQMFSFDRGVIEALVMTAIGMAFDMIFISIGCLAAIKIMDMSLGAPGEAALKIMAIALVPSAIDGMITANVPMGFFLAMAISLGIYWAMLAWFFDLDGGEVMILTTIIWVMRTWVSGFIIVFLLSSLMNMNSSNSGAAGVMSSMINAPAVKTDSSPAGKVNARAENLKMTLDSGEAEEWLKESPTHRLYSMSADESMRIVRALYDAGAEEVHTGEINKRNDVIESDKLVVELPESPAKRKAVMAVLVPFMNTRDLDLMPVDNGPDQVYVVYHLDGNDG